MNADTTMPAAEQPAPRSGGPGGFLGAIARRWQRVSPRAVPILAVITAFLAGIPVMIVIEDLDARAGLQLSQRAYAALIEGATGLAVDDVADAGDFETIRQYAQDQELDPNELARQSVRLDEIIVPVGVEDMRRYEAFMAAYPGLDALADDPTAFTEQYLPDYRQQIRQRQTIALLEDDRANVLEFLALNLPRLRTLGVER
ncbi:MAG: hypothetical protein HC915_19625, partial [Anaerolineae bacterium]|nr:hypothetical protein [Anaerolineae bacterium]